MPRTAFFKEVIIVRTQNRNSIEAALISFVLVVVLLGYFTNIYKLFSNNDFASPYKSEVIRAIGIPVIPVGMIVGWMKFDGER